MKKDRGVVVCVVINGDLNVRVVKTTSLKVNGIGYCRDLKAGLPSDP